MDSKNYPSYYRSYINRVPEGNLIDLLSFGHSEAMKTLVMIAEDKGSYAYQEGKWTIKQMLQHMIDTERIFCYRAVAIARGENKPIQGFDHNAYADNGLASNRSIKSLLEEMKRLRLSTIDLFSSFDDQTMKRKGTANEQEIAVEQIGFIIVGHEMHHVAILEERYL